MNALTFILSFILWCGTIFGTSDFMQNELSESLHHSYIETSEARIAIWDSKPNDIETPAVIFIPGHCTNKNFFAKQLLSKQLKDYRLIAVDLPGYGKSGPPHNPEKTYSFPGFARVVSELIELLHLKNVIVVGWSLGGHVAMELTSFKIPLKGILITGAPPIEISAEGLGHGFKVANPKILECFGKGNLSYEEAELLATVCGYNYTEEKKFIVDAVLETDEGAKTIYPKSILEGIGQNELKIVSEWSNPIAVIAGEKDAGINNDYIMHEVKFKNLWNGKVYVIPNAGHAVIMEQPDEFNSILQNFLKEIFVYKKM